MRAPLIFALVVVLSFAPDAWAMPRAPWRRAPAAIALHVLALLFVDCLMLALTARAVFCAFVAVVLVGLMAVISNAKRRVLREPLLFTDLSLLQEVFRHPRLYLPFLGAPVVGAIAFGIVIFIASCRVESPLPWWYRLLALLVALVCVAAGRWLAARLPLALDPDEDQRRHGFFAVFVAYLLNGLRRETFVKLDERLAFGPFADSPSTEDAPSSPAAPGAHPDARSGAYPDMYAHSGAVHAGLRAPGPGVYPDMYAHSGPALVRSLAPPPGVYPDVSAYPGTRSGARLDEHMSERMNEHMDARPETCPDARPDIIVIQSESWFDARRLGEAIKPSIYTGFDRARRECVVHGELTVPAWGANTMRSEFSMLTGVASACLGYARFYPYAFLRRACASLPGWFRRGGYRTLAIHPFYADFFGRDRVFPLLGFDAFTDIAGFAHARRVGPYIADAAVTDAILAELARAQDRPAFIFAMTMESHGPLHLEPVQPGEAQSWHTLGEENAWRDLTVYLRHAVNADAMIARLLAHLRARDRPAMLCFYGDHVPALPAAYDALGKTPERSDYFIWTNFSKPSSEKRNARIENLGAMMVEVMRNTAMGKIMSGICKE